MDERLTSASIHNSYFTMQRSYAENILSVQLIQANIVSVIISYIVASFLVFSLFLSTTKKKVIIYQNQYQQHFCLFTEHYKIPWYCAIDKTTLIDSAYVTRTFYISPGFLSSTLYHPE